MMQKPASPSMKQLVANNDPRREAIRAHLFTKESTGALMQRRCIAIEIHRRGQARLTLLQVAPESPEAVTLAFIVAPLLDIALCRLTVQSEGHPTPPNLCGRLLLHRWVSSLHLENAFPDQEGQYPLPQELCCCQCDADLYAVLIEEWRANQMLPEVVQLAIRLRKNFFFGISHGVATLGPVRQIALQVAF